MLLFRSSLSSGGGEANYDAYGINAGGNFIEPDEIKLNFWTQPSSPRKSPLPINFNEPITIGEHVTECPGLLQYCNEFNQPVNLPVNMTNLFYGFQDCTNFNQPINLPTPTEESNLPFPPFTPVVRNLAVDLVGLFYNCVNFNQPIVFPPRFSGSQMFWGCINFNQPIDFSNSTIEGASAMFYGCEKFNQPIEITEGLSGKDDFYSDMGQMFYGCSNFNAPVIFNGSDISISDFEETFAESNFNQPLDLSNIYTEEGNFNFIYTLYNTPFNQPIIFPTFVDTNIIIQQPFPENFNYPINIMGNGYITWNEGLILGNFNSAINIDPNIRTSDMSNGFMYCSNLNAPINLPTFECNWLEPDIIGFTTYSMFFNCRNFNQPLNFNFYKPNIMDSININMSFTLWNCVNFNQPVTFDVDNLPWNMLGEVSMSGFFMNCSKFNQPIEIPRGVTSTSSMFFNCQSFNQEYIELPDRVTNCYNMFYHCNHIDFIDVYKHNYDIGVPFNCKGFVSFMPNTRRCLINISGDSDTVIQEYYQHFTTQAITNSYSAPQWTEGPNWGRYNTKYNIYVIYNLDEYNNWNS